MERPPLAPSRRRVLGATGVAGLVAVAGCSLPSLRAESCSEATALSLAEATVAHVSNEFSTPLEALSHATEPVVADALDAGEAASRGYYSPRVATEYVVAGSEPRYYRVTTTERDRTETTGYEYSAEIGVDASGFSGDPVPFPSLPAHDREALRSAIGNTGLLHAPHYTSFSVVFAYVRDEERDRSRFVPDLETRYVEWEDAVLRLDPEAQRTVPITRTVVTTDLVAESPDEFREHVGGECGAVLAGLTSRQRDILARAIDDRYTECEPYAEPFGGLLDRLSTGEHECERERGIAPLARYEDAWYFVHVSHPPDESP